MKLHYLELIGQYKGLSNQKFDFRESDSNIIALVGLNGAGKSNFLELVAEIFCFLERAKRQDFISTMRLSFDFILNYTIMDNEEPSEFLIEYNYGKLWPRREFEGGFVDTPIDYIQLPSFVVAYSSSRNENLQRAFLKNSVRFFEVVKIKSNRNKLIQKNINDDDEQLKINIRYLKTHKHLYNINQDVYQYLEDSITYEDFPNEIKNLILSLSDSPTKTPDSVYVDTDTELTLLASLLVNADFDYSSLLPEISHPTAICIILRYDLREIQNIPDAIDDLKQLIRIAGDDNIQKLSRRTTDRQFELFGLDSLVGEIKILLSTPQIKSDFCESFYQRPATLFQKLYKLQLQAVGNWPTSLKNNLKNDSFMDKATKPTQISKPIEVCDIILSNGDSLMSIHDLSDGEMQIMQTAALFKIFKEEDALFLMDEPDTHLNPHWRTEFYSYLQGHSDGHQMFISTHSPFMLSSLDKRNVFHFQRNDGELSVTQPTEQTFGSSFEYLSKRFFDMDSLIAKTAIDKINDVLKDETHSEARAWMEANVGPSLEKTFLMKQLED